MSQVIVHTGTKDQKWGFRRYRNYDGTLTEEGKKRYDYYENKTDRVYKKRDTAALATSVPKPKRYVKSNKWGVMREDLSQYSNDELQRMVTRAKLEKDYRDYFNTEKYTKGKKFLEGVKNTGRELSDLIKVGNDLYKNSMAAYDSYMRNVSDKERRATEKENKKAAMAFVAANATTPNDVDQILNLMKKFNDSDKSMKNYSSDWGSIIEETRRKKKEQEENRRNNGRGKGGK